MSVIYPIPNFIINKKNPLHSVVPKSQVNKVPWFKILALQWGQYRELLTWEKVISTEGIQCNFTYLKVVILFLRLNVQNLNVATNKTYTLH